MHPVIPALASVTLSALAQLAMKRGMTQVTALDAARGDSGAVAQVLGALLNPLVAAGFVLYALGAVIWLYALARWDVSKAYPLVGFGFVLTAVFATLWLGERVSLERMAGIALICAGIVLVART